jgi:hypothetical protein
MKKMNIKAIFNAEMNEGKRQAFSPRSNLVVSLLVAVSVVTISTLLHAAISPAATEYTAENARAGDSYATSPEPWIVHRYATGRVDSSESEMLAANPELSAARRFAEIRAAGGEAE